MGDPIELEEIGQAKLRTTQNRQRPNPSVVRNPLRLPQGLTCPLPPCPCRKKGQQGEGRKDKDSSRDKTKDKEKVNDKDKGSIKDKIRDSRVVQAVRKDSVKKDKRKPPIPVIKEFDVCYKILLIGDSGVGKTALVRTLLGKDFLPKALTTVGMDFVNTILEVDGVRVKLQIWDTAGQERFRSMTRFQFRGTQGALLVYDITERETFKPLSYWLQLVDSEIDQYNKEPIPVYLIGNKADKAEQRQVPYKKGLQFAEQQLMRGFMETSAKTSKNVHEAVTQLALAVLEVNNPKLMDSYLDPLERTEKYEIKQKEAEAVAQYQLRKQRSRIRLASQLSRTKSFERVQKCCSH